tara:strand:+ start:152 stop:1483 length:1332 start_codon:yes stop_codon:yes gene_type:complete
MKRIDFIFKNFQADSFIKDIRNGYGGYGWCEDAILKNTLDYNDLEYQLNYLKFFYGDINKTLKKRKNKSNEHAYKVIINFFKNNQTINKKNIDKYFVKKKIYNLSSLGFDFSGDTDDWSDEESSLRQTLAHYVDTGIFFRNIKEFSLVYEGQIKFEGRGLYEYEILCFYSKTDKKYHLLILFLEADGNDSYLYVNSFKNKPNLNQIKSSIDSNKDYYTLMYYRSNKKNIKSYLIYKPSKNFELDNFWRKELKLGINLKRVEKKIFRDEDSFYNNFKDDGDIIYNYIKRNPSKYFSSQNASNLINKHFKEYPNQKFKNFNFFKFIMSDKFRYKYDLKFINEIIHKKDDVEGLLSFIPIKTQNNKELAEEIRILRMLRSKNKNFIIKVIKTNKDKIYDLAVSYMPSSIFDDPKLMMEMIKIDTNVISLIGNKLKKNKKFMKDVWK